MVLSEMNHEKISGMHGVFAGEVRAVSFMLP